MKKSLYFLIFTAFILVYHFNIIVPFADNHNFSSEACMPDKDAIWLFALITWIPYFLYWTVFLKNIKSCKYIRFILVPISTYIFYMGGLICLAAIPTIDTFMLTAYTILIFFWIFVMSIPISMWFDTKDVMEYCKNLKQNQISKE